MEFLDRYDLNLFFVSDTEVSCLCLYRIIISISFVTVGK